MKKLIFTLAIVALSSCEYTTPLCNLNNVVDVPGIDRPLTVVAPNDKFQVEKQTTQLKRIAKGSYEGNAYTCAHNGKIIFESKNDYGNWSAMILNESATTFNLTLTSFDRRQLDAYQVPYRIEKRKNSSLFPNLMTQNQGAFEDESTSEQLIVDNAQVSADLIIQLLQSTSFSINLYK